MNRYGSGSFIRWESLALRLEQIPSQVVQEGTDDPALVRRQIPMETICQLIRRMLRPHSQVSIFGSSGPSGATGTLSRSGPDPICSEHS